MEIKLTLALPRDQVSVPVVRRILKASLETLGIESETVSDIEIALTEACTNVLDHAAGGTEYEVSAGIDGTVCVIEVVDRGASEFDATMRGLAEADPAAEGGRGIQLMRALVDRVTFTNEPKDGTVVHLEKQLTFGPGAVLERLDRGRTRHGPWSEDEHLGDGPGPR
jgi:serine/threonine-protein kinase RsbW